MTRGSLNGKVVAITGAGSGIGCALAQLAAKRGAKLALSDWNDGGLAETVASLGSGVEVTSAKVDVSDRAAVAAWAADVVKHFGTVNMQRSPQGVYSYADAPTFPSTFDAVNYWVDPVFSP